MKQLMKLLVMLFPGLYVRSRPGGNISYQLLSLASFVRCCRKVRHAIKAEVATASLSAEGVAPSCGQLIQFQHNRKNSHVLENRLSDESRPMNHYFSFGKMKAVSQPAFQIWRTEVWDYSASWGFGTWKTGWRHAIRSRKAQHEAFGGRTN
jgi:hypothetical protein